MKKIAIPIILLIVLLISSFSVIAISLVNPPLQEAVYNTPVEVLSSSCSWETDHFTACAYVRWQKSFGNYAQVQIYGGEALELSPKQTSSPFTYCQSVGTDEGKRSIQAFLLTYSNTFKSSDTSHSVNCVKSKPQTISVEKNLSFRIESINSRASSSGTLKLTELPGTPVSCDFKGTWITDNRMSVTGTRGRCDEAGGQFTGHADLARQYTTEDPSSFDWKMFQGIFDPPAHTDQNYFFSATTCDSVRYDEHRNYARAYVSQFEKDGILIDWDYNNAESKPAVDVRFIMTCDVIPDNAKPVPAEKSSADSASSKDFFNNQPEVTTPSKPAEETSPAITIAPAKPTIWNIISGWFRKVFMQ